MKKNKLRFLAVFFLFTMILSSCGGGNGSSSQDNSDFNIEFGGLSDKILKVRESVNVLGLIAVYGTDSLSYLSNTKATSDCTLTGDNKNILTSDVPKTCVVEYTTTVNGKEYKASKKFIFESYPLTNISISGTSAKFVAQNTEFNVLEGVSAIGDDDADYTSSLVFTSENCTITNNILDTSEMKVCNIKYSVTSGDVKAEVTRYVSITETLPVNIFNNDLTSASTLQFGGEDELLLQDPADSFRLWYVDGDWEGCGPRTTIKYLLANGSLTIDSENLNGNTNNWNTQLYYKTQQVTKAGLYVLEFDVYAENARKIIFDRKTQSANVSTATLVGADANSQVVVQLQEGSNHVRVGFNAKLNDVIMMKILLGKVEPSYPDDLGQLRFSNFSVYDTSSLGLYELEIRGLTDEIINAKTEFDVKKDVTVIGNDLKTYNDALIVTCDTATITNNKLDTSNPGTYVLKYKAVKDGIESSVYERTITIIGEDELINILSNGKFDTAVDPWICDGGSSSKFICNAVDGKLNIDINNAGATLDYHGQVIQTGLTGLNKNRVYRVVIKASSTIARPLEIRIQEQGGGWNTVKSKKINLTPELKEYSFDYEALTTYGTIQFGILLGKFEGIDVTGDHKVVIDEVVFADMGPLPPEQQVEVGTTQFFGNPLTDPDTLIRTSGAETTRADDKINIWYVESLAWNCGAIVDGDFTIGNGKFTADMRTLGDNNWSVQFNYKTKLVRESGTYRATFKVNSDVSKVIIVRDLGVEKEIRLNQGENNVTINFNVAANQPVHIYMAMGKFASDTVTHAKLEFYDFSIVKV